MCACCRACSGNVRRGATLRRSHLSHFRWLVCLSVRPGMWRSSQLVLWRQATWRNRDMPDIGDVPVCNVSPGHAGLANSLRVPCFVTRSRSVLCYIDRHSLSSRRPAHISAFAFFIVRRRWMWTRRSSSVKSLIIKPITHFIGLWGSCSVWLTLWLE